MSHDREQVITLGHGGGGRLMHELITGELLAASDVMTEADMEDAALIAGGALAMTTDSFTVQPLFFPGGDIGTLAVNGTVNDLAMRGARARWLSIGMIIEEGLPLSDLRRIVRSIRDACATDGVHVITGDTKVVERGAADGIFINSTGVGEVFADPVPGATLARPGDVALVSGTLGDHGVAILAAREQLGLTGELASDCVSLLSLVEGVWQAVGDGLHCLRDATRGGLAAALNEIAMASGVSIEIHERALPIRSEVRGACELLGLTPLEIANEGKLLAVVSPDAADAALAAMRALPTGIDAAIIGTVGDGPAGRVSALTPLGTSRIVDLPAGELLPRIC